MYYAGIDVGKRKHVVQMMDSQGKVDGKAKPIANDREGFAQLQALLTGVAGPVEVGLEATGHYWLALYSFLIEEGFAVTVLNPLQVHAYRRRGIRKCKTDSNDAGWIADYIRIGGRGTALSTAPDQAQLRELTRFRASLTRQVGECKCRIVGILDRVFPEYERLFSNIFIQSSRTLLAEAVTPEEFAGLDLSELSQLLAQASRGRFGVDKAQEVQATARNSIGVGFLGDVLRTQLHCLLEQLTLLEQQQQQLDQQIESIMDRLNQYLTTIPGMGRVTAATILAEIGDIHRFSKPEKLVAYAGIDPTVFQSGQFSSSQNHMSKRGSPTLRLALWQAAFRVSLHDPALAAYYHRKRAEGKAHGTALGAVARKLLHRIYIILKEQRPYEIRDQLALA